MIFLVVTRYDQLCRNGFAESNYAGFRINKLDCAALKIKTK